MMERFSNFLARPHIPDSHAAVLAGRCQMLAIRAEFDELHLVAVFKRAAHYTGFNVANQHRLAVRCRDAAPIRAQAKMAHQGITDMLSLEHEVAHVPNRQEI